MQHLRKVGLPPSDVWAEQRTCRHTGDRSPATSTHWMHSWANFFPELSGVFSASCVSATTPKAVISLAGTGNTTWQHNLTFLSKLPYHQQRGQHSHLVDMGVFHWWLHVSFKAFSSSTPVCWLCRRPYLAGEQDTELLHWGDQSYFEALKERCTEASCLISQLVFFSWLLREESLNSRLVRVLAWLQLLLQKSSCVPQASCYLGFLSIKPGANVLP